MLQELKQLRKVLLRLLGVFVLLVLALFAVPVASGKSLVALALERIRVDVVPEGVSLIITNPVDAFLTQVTLAVYLALLFLAPAVLFEAWRFAAPGLYHAERRGLSALFTLGVLLWYAGVAFAYLVLIPVIFSALYGFLPEEIVPLFSLRELVSLTAGFSLLAAVAFLMPVLMIGLSRAGLVAPAFWGANARVAVLVALVASAILTPDGSGVSAVLLALPISALYAAGYAGAKFLDNQFKSRTQNLNM